MNDERENVKVIQQFLSTVPLELNDSAKNYLLGALANYVSRKNLDLAIDTAQTCLREYGDGSPRKGADTA
jgi:hypothetical protein